MKQVNRRDFIITTGLGAVGLLAPCITLARDATESKQIPTRVGISLSMSGEVAAIGNSVWRGASLHNKLNQSKLPPGVKIDTELRDDGGSSSKIKRIAREMIGRDHVRVLGGVSISPQAFALAPLVTKAEMPLIVMNASTSSITRKSPYIIRVSHTNWQTSHTLGEWAARHGYKKAYTMVSDYAAGHDSERAFAKGFADAGGKIVGSVRTPMSATDYLPYMSRVKDAGADALYIFINAGHLDGAITAFASSGLKGSGMALIGPGDVALDDEIANMSNDAEGLITAGCYYAGNPVKANRDFVNAWQQEYGEHALPNEEAAAGWDGMAAIYDLIRAYGGGFDTDQAMEFLSHWKNPDSPRGAISIDPETRDIVQSIYINRVEMVDGRPFNVNMDKLPDVKDPWKILNPPQ